MSPIEVLEDAATRLLAHGFAAAANARNAAAGVGPSPAEVAALYRAAANDIRKAAGRRRRRYPREVP